MYVRNDMYTLLQESVYPWQEMHIWYLLIQSNKRKNTDILKLAKQRAREKGYDEGAQNYIFIFLGKHGDYQDKKYMAEIFLFKQSFRARRSLSIALQEYADRNILYNQITPKNSYLILVSLVKYIKQLTSPEYVDVNNNIGSEIAFS